jgi:hypothetical protein
MYGDEDSFHVGKVRNKAQRREAYVHRAALKDAGLLLRTWRMGRGFIAPTQQGLENRISYVAKASGLEVIRKGRLS